MRSMRSMRSMRLMRLMSLYRELINDKGRYRAARAAKNTKYFTQQIQNILPSKYKIFYTTNLNILGRKYHQSQLDLNIFGLIHVVKVFIGLLCMRQLLTLGRLVCKVCYFFSRKACTPLAQFTLANLFQPLINHYQPEILTSPA